MKSFNCPDCYIYEATYDTYDLCNSCARNKNGNSNVFVYSPQPLKPTSALCGRCGSVLIKQYPPDYSSTIIKELWCPECKEYPVTITYIMEG